MIRLCTFGTTPGYARALKLLEQEANASGYFDEVVVYRQENLPAPPPLRQFMQTHPRGYGFWIWKSLALRDVMAKAGPDDVVFYADAGCGISTAPAARARFAEWIRDVRTHPSHRLSLQMDHMEETWTKADLFAFMGCDEGRFRKTGQHVGGIQAYLNTPENRAFLREHTRIASAENFHFISDEPSEIPNAATFREHRHDQSILSLLYKREGSACRPDHCDDPAFPIVAIRRRDGESAVPGRLAHRGTAPPVLNLWDENFRHQSCSTWGKRARNVGYRRDLLEWNGITLFTDAYLHSEAPDRVHSRRKIGWLLEPPSINPWLYENFASVVDRFDFTLTYEQSLLDRFPGKTRFSPWGGCWIRSEDMRVHRKSKDTSMIYSEKRFAPGHLLRHEVASHVQGVDLFGRGVAPIERKEQGLLDYRFSIVIENGRIRNYFTEKLVDCLAVGTVPIYWGCPNIGDFFDDRGILSFESPDELRTILSTATPERYAELAEIVDCNFATSLRYEITDDWIAEHILRELT